MSEKALSISSGPRASRIAVAPQRPCRDFCAFQPVPFRELPDFTWLPEDSDPTDPRNACLSRSRHLPINSPTRLDNPVNIAARPRKAVDDPCRNRVANSDEDNREGPGRLLGGEGPECASAGHDDINLERNQFGPARAGSRSTFPSAYRVSIRRLRPSTYPRSSSPWRNGLLMAGFRGRASSIDKPNPPYLPRLLRLGGQRRGEEAAAYGTEERASVHKSSVWRPI